MIAGIFHEGSGLGDQLFRYITVRTLAEEKGWRFTIINPENFKGDAFLALDMGKRDHAGTASHFYEKEVRDVDGTDIRSYDPEINFIENNTAVDGSFEDSKYWEHNLAHINKWLAVEPLKVPDDLCIISHRGGEYKLYPELYLPDAYWHYSISKMLEINPKMKFQIQTDDSPEARRIFPSFEVIDNQEISHSRHSNMSYNWRAIRYANYLIVGNSAFSIIPSLLSPAKVILAPRYHAGHNVGIWKRPACYYERYQYISPSDYL